MAQGFYLKTSNGWKSIKDFFVKTSSGWKPIQFAYVKTSMYGWKSFYTRRSSYPQNTVSPTISAGTYAITAITGFQALVGTTLTGNKGTWTSTNGSITYSYLWFADGISTGNTTTSFNTSSYDGSYITFQVTARNASGTTIARSDQIEVTKNQPSPIDWSLSTNTPRVGDILSVTTHWQSDSNIIPDYYTATFTSNSGVYTYNSQQTSYWYQYYVQSSDVGYPISVVVLAYNTGAPAGINTPTMTTNNVGYQVPVNTYLPYWTDTSNNAFSGQVESGTTLRLHFGSWTNNPTYYKYQVIVDNFSGTTLAQDMSGTYTNTYVDITFNSITNSTFGGYVYAGNSGGLSNVATTPSIGKVIPAGPGPFSITNFYDSSPTPSIVSVDTPYQGSGATASTLYYTWTAPIIYDYLGNAYTVANFNSRYTGPATSNSDTRTVTNDFWPNAITQSGYYYAYVAAVNSSVLQVTANWTASTNAAYYKVVYTINGNTYTSSALYTTSWSFLSSSTITFNGVIAYNSDATRTTIVSYNQDITPTSKTGSEGSNYAYLTYSVVPTITMGSTTNISSSGTATINWTSTNESYALVNGSYAGNVNSYTFYGLSAGNYSGTVTVYSSTGSSASASYSFTIPSPTYPPSTPSVYGSNDGYPHGGHFYFSSSGTLPITYYWTVYRSNGAVYGSSATTQGFVSVGITGAFYCKVYAGNAYGISSTATSSTVTFT